MTRNYILQAADLGHELVFVTSRSSGPGGQNVNKVNTRVTLRWDVANSSRVSHEQKKLLMEKLTTRMSKEGVLILTAQDKRSQLHNKDAVLVRLDRLLTKVFTIKKIRKATVPGKAAKQRRINEKKLHGEKKQWRQKL